MSQLRVVTWNAEGMFVEGTKTRRATPRQAVHILQRLDADIVVVPEFGRLSDLTDETKIGIHALGYELTTLAYDEPRTPGLHFAILSRLPIKQTTVHNLGTSKRQMLEVVCGDSSTGALHIFGVHLDDRSEAGRMIEIAAVSDVINARASKRIMLLGDFNAMHRSSRFATVARNRASRQLVKLVPSSLVRDVATRVSEMAIGTTIDYLLSHTYLQDLDVKRKATISAKQAGLEWVPSWKLAKIDWIFASRDIKIRRYRIFGDVGSDHRPVVVDIEINNIK